MRRRTLRTLLATLAGALVGGIVVFFFLAAVGKRQGGEGAGLVGEPLGTTKASPAAAALAPAAPPPSPTVAASPALPGRVELGTELGIAITLPEGYRLAAKVNALGGGRRSPAQVTITRASVSREEEYVRVLEDLAAKQVATDAPIFAPGETIVFHEITSPTAEEGDAPFARGKEGVKTASGLLGTRYRRVEGIHTYDMTYLALPSGKKVGVQMSYRSDEPRFDEAAYGAVLTSIEAL